MRWVRLYGLLVIGKRLKIGPIGLIGPIACSLGSRGGLAGKSILFWRRPIDSCVPTYFALRACRLCRSAPAGSILCSSRRRRKSKMPDGAKAHRAFCSGDVLLTRVFPHTRPTGLPSMSLGSRRLHSLLEYGVAGKAKCPTELKLIGHFVLATSYSRTTYRRTTIGAAAFHFRVRNVNGWCHCAMVTRGES